MFVISDLAKNEFASIDKIIGKGNIQQAVITAKEARDIVISNSSSVQAKKRIIQTVFTKKYNEEAINEFNVTVIMIKNPYNKDECSSKEEYHFNWIESEEIWKLENIIES